MIKKLIQKAEFHREIYLGLLEDLQENIIKDWYPHYLSITSNNIRKWLDLVYENNFNSLRKIIEDKGIIVILSDHRTWKFPENNHISGFSLYYDIYPIIVLKNRNERQLLYHLIHLILYKESLINGDQNNKEINYIVDNVLNFPYIETINTYGKKFVNTVFDTLSNNHITLNKASTYLDNLEISKLRKLEKEL